MSVASFSKSSKLTSATKNASCPVCGGIKHCKTRDSGRFVLCKTITDKVSTPSGWAFRGLDRKCGQWGIFTEDDDYRGSGRVNGAKPAKAVKVSAKPIKTNAAQRDREMRSRLASKTLNQKSLDDLRRRGLSDAEIEHWGVKSGKDSYGNDGYYCPAYRHDGTIIGSQFKVLGVEGSSYKAVKFSDGVSSFNGEVPLTVHRPMSGKAIGIAMVEGIGAKSYLTAQYTGQVTIGFGSYAYLNAAPNLMAETLAALSKELGTKTIAFYPDGGATKNPNVTIAYLRAFETFEAMGYTVDIKWWKQLEKSDGDADEIDNLASVASISKENYIKVAKEEGGLFKGINQLGEDIYTFEANSNVRKAIGKKYNIDCPKQGDFWKWVRSAPVTPVITQSPEMAQNLLSQGTIAIGVTGKVDDSVTEIRKLCKGKNVVLHHDGGNIARLWVRKLANKLIGVFSIVVTEDFETFTPIGEWAVTAIPAWARSIVADLGNPSNVATFTFNCARVSDANIPMPALGSMLMLDSAMGTGKTFWFSIAIEHYEALYGDDLIVDFGGHRNNLLKQTASRLGLVHISEIEAKGVSNQSLRDNTDRLVYCFDSFMKRVDSLLSSIAAGKKLLFCMDEADAVWKHILVGSTIRGGRRLEIITKLAELFAAISSGGGWVIAAEAGLSQLAIEAFERMGASMPLTIAQNQAKAPAWNVSIMETDKAQTARNAGMMVFAAIQKAFDAGLRVLLMTTSQVFGESADIHFARPDRKIIRHDSKTIDEPQGKAFALAAGDEMRIENADLTICSPTVESGISIDGKDLVDLVIVHSTNLEGSTALQLAGRLRDASVPRLFCLADTAIGANAKIVSADDLEQKWTANTDSSIKHIHCMKTQLPINAEATAIALKLAAKYTVRAEANKHIHKERIISLLEMAGHNIEYVNCDLDGTEGESITAAKAAIDAIRKAEYQKADDSKLTAEAAKEKSKGEIKWDEKVLCTKAIDRAKFGEIIDESEWIDGYWANAMARKKGMAAMRFAAEWENPGMAEEVDSREITYQMRKYGAVWAGDFAGRRRGHQLLRAIGWESIMALVKTGNPIHAKHPDVITIYAAAIAECEEISEVLGLTVKEGGKPMEFINDVLRNRMGYVCSPIYLHTEEPSEPGAVGRPSQGKRYRGYLVTEAPYRAEMIAGFVKDFEAYEVHELEEGETSETYLYEYEPDDEYEAEMEYEFTEDPDD
jgi:hypothetical protein